MITYRTRSRLGRPAVARWLLLLATVWFQSGSAEAAGAIDPTFRPSVGWLGSAEGKAIVAQANGQIVIAGTFFNINGIARKFLARLNTDGSLDPSFPAGLGPDDEVVEMFGQADGKIIILGRFHNVNGAATSHGLARLNADGSLDDSFHPSLGTNDFPFTAALQPDGKILIGLYASATDPSDIHHDRIARFNSDGSADPSFRSDTSIEAASIAFLNPMVIQANGKIVVTGLFDSVNGQVHQDIARLNPDGSVDSSFNVDLGNNHYVTVVALQPDDDILLGGIFSTINGFSVANNQAYLIRLTVNGSYDGSFQSGPHGSGPMIVQRDGRILLSENGVIRLEADGSQDNSFHGELATLSTVKCFGLQSDGKILAAGSIVGAIPTALARLNANGSLDSSFSPRFGGYAGATQITLQADGKILIGGSFNDIDGATHYGFARLNANGALDPSFNPPVTASASVIVIQPDGKILLGGNFSINGAPRNFLARFNPDGSVDPSFNTGATLTDNVTSIALQPDGQILIAGGFRQTNGIYQRPLSRLNSDGSLDNSFAVSSSLASDFGSRLIGVLGDGRILATVAFSSSGPVHNRFVRLFPDGSIDNTFRQDVETNQAVGATAIQADGKILIGGYFTAINSVPQNHLARLNSDGSLDSSFDIGSGPASDTSPGLTNINALAVQPGGGILIGGEFTNYNGVTRGRIARLDSGGSLDSSFDPGSGANDTVMAITVQADGKILVGGFFSTINNGTHLTIARLLEGPAPAQPLNISTRLRVLAGDNVLIGGFIITGTDPKKIIVRAIGPSLRNVGVNDALADPVLELHEPGGAVLTNDNWKDNQEAEIAATAFAPGNELESAIVAPLPPGAYTAVVRGQNNGTGVGLVEAYDLDPTADSQLANISTRGFVDTGENVMIGGLIAGPMGAGNSQMLVRAIGPSLANFGVQNAVQDPTLELYDGNGNSIATNDNWKIRSDGSSQQAEIEATKITPNDDRESGLLPILAPGNYTAIVRGKDNGVGVALVEIYDLQ
ncbi:MAG: hypothetical protein ABR611_13170 [Chthoniobacterales bacterium]